MFTNVEKVVPIEIERNKSFVPTQLALEGSFDILW
jgi:hypothetical protein